MVTNSMDRESNEGALPLDQQLSHSLRRTYVDEFQSRIFAQVAAGSKVLDLGGERAKPRGFFSLTDYPVQHTALNLFQSTRPDLVADAAKMPLVSEAFDIVLCAELLEHVAYPDVVLRQAFEVLRPGGMLVITVPFLFRLHGDPSDYGRYTADFWQAHLQAIGFDNITVEKQGLLFSVAADMLRDWSRYLVLEERINYRFGSWLLSRVVKWARRRALRFDTRSEFHTHAFWGAYTTGFGVTATKPRS